MPSFQPSLPNSMLPVCRSRPLECWQGRLFTEWLDISWTWMLPTDSCFHCGVVRFSQEEILREPGKFVQLDPDIPQTLLDQREAGKKLLLITNSEYEYTDRMMSFAIDRFLPEGMKWRDLFEMVGIEHVFCILESERSTVSVQFVPTHFVARSLLARCLRSD